MHKIIPLLSLLFFTSIDLHALVFSLEQPHNLTKTVAANISTNNADLCAVAKNSRVYLEQFSDDTFAVHSGKVFEPEVNVTLARVKKTLDFICKTYQEDKLMQKNASTNLEQTANNHQTLNRLNQRDFLLKHFDFIRWYPDKNNADKIADKSDNQVKSRLLNNIPEQKIFLTKYYTKLLNGSPVKTDQFTQALYALPFDEQQFTLEEAENKKSQLTRFKYTRQQVIAGELLNKKVATPLVWLTEDALHDVLLQGTGVLIVEGKTRFFNVHRNNGIAYDYSLGKKQQARYWYFIETPGIMGYGKDQASKIAITPQVTLAGNVAQLGLGKLLMLSYPFKNETVSRMAILADQGGAFDNNLFQLDLLVDSYRGWDDYHQANKNLPDYAYAWFMLLKE